MCRLARAACVLLVLALCLSRAAALRPVAQSSCRRLVRRGRDMLMVAADEVDYVRKIKPSSSSSSSSNKDIMKDIVTMTSEMNASSATKSKSKSKRYPSNIEEKRRQLDKVLQLSRLQGGPSEKIGLTELNQLITTAGRLARAHDSLEIFHSIGKFGHRADLMSFNNIIWAAGNCGKADLAKKMYSELLQRRLQPNVYTFGSLLHGCARVKGGHQQALQYLDAMAEMGVEPNLVVFTSAMEACAESGHYREALGIMDRMRSRGMRPDLTMVNAGIKACSLAGAMDEAEGLAEGLREYGSMDVFTYHTLMMGNTKLGRHYRVLALYDEAIASNASLDGGVYSLAMLASLNCGLFLQVPSIAERARAEGVALTEAAYTILIQALAEAGLSQAAVDCLTTMSAEGLKPNVITYAAVMTACRDKPDTVIGLLDEMRLSGLTPNTVVLTTAIDSLARAGGLFTDSAYAMLQSMERDGPEPNIYTYNTVSRAFAEAGRMDEALLMLNSIRSRGLEPDRFTFTTLLIACGRNSNSARVGEIMGIMKASGVVPDEIAYGAAIDAHRRAGDSLKAVECLHDMYRNKIAPSAAHYNLVLRTLRSQGYVDKMFQMIMAISAKEEVKINSNTFELVIEALLDLGKWKESLLLIRTMDKMGFSPSIAVYVALVEQLEKARQYKIVLALYRLMSRDGHSFYENPVLNTLFKKIISIGTLGMDDDINRSASALSRELVPVEQSSMELLEAMIEDKKKALAAKA